MTHRRHMRLKGMTGILPALLLAYVLLLSGLFGGVAAGMAVAPAADAMVLCSSSGTAPQDGGQAHKPACPCALLCQMGGAGLALAAAGEPSPVTPAFYRTVPLRPALPALTPDAFGLIAAARAPPAISA